MPEAYNFKALTSASSIMSFATDRVPSATPANIHLSRVTKAVNLTAYLGANHLCKFIALNMDVDTAQPTGLHHPTASFSVADDDMDIDFSLDADEEQDSREIQPQPQEDEHYGGTGDTEVMEGEPVPNKVHVFLQVDTLDSSAVKRLAGEHYSLDAFERIEWVNDTEVNLIYNSEDTAREALYAFTLPGGSAPEEIPVMDVRPARQFSGAPGVEMRVRLAKTTDVKKKGAADESRYYLLNPEKDPRERARKRQMRQRRDWDGEAGGYEKNRFDDKEHKRRRGEDRWEASMYDEDDNVDMDANNGEEDRGRRKRVRFTGRRDGEDLFADKLRNSGRRLRRRSASPLRGNGEGLYGFDAPEEDISAARRRIRQRSPTPPRLRNHSASSELFPHLLDRRPGGLGKGVPPKYDNELFPEKLIRERKFSNNMTEDLFPEKLAVEQRLSNTSPVSRFGPEDLFTGPLKRRGSNHRRTDAIDASPRINSTSSLSPELKPRLSLAERITGGPAGKRLNGTGGVLPLAARITKDSGTGGGSLASRITPRDNEIEEFSIKGRSSATDNSGSELFPNKMKGNSRLGM